MLFSSDFVINDGTIRTGPSGYDMINPDGTGQGPVANALAGIQAVPGVRFDAGLLRPFFGDDGHQYVTVNTGRKKLVEVRHPKSGKLISKKMEPIFAEVRIKDLREAGVSLPMVTNATSLRKDEWIQFDAQTIPPRRERLRFYNDIARVATFSFNGMGTMMLEHETVSDPGRAYQDMNGLSEGTNDSPLFQLEGQPVPVTHAEFAYDLRRLEVSRGRGTGLNTRGVEWATRRVLELVDDVAVGIAGTAVSFGPGTTTQYGTAPGVYGIGNYPNRILKTNNTIPTGSNPDAIRTDILNMRDLMYAAKHYGPYGIYHSTDYDAYLDAPYAYGTGGTFQPTMTLRQAIMTIGVEEGDGGTSMSRQIKFVKRLDRMTPARMGDTFRMFMVSLDGNSIRALNGMPITVFQYETRGGWMLHFKVACIMLTEHFTDFAGNCGIMDATAN